MPWIHLYIDTNGYAKACCNSSITYGSIREKTVESIWNSDSIKEFRKNLLAGVKDKRCAACYKREDAGKESIRTETLQKYKHINWQHETEEDGSSAASTPIYLDIRYSNICNLKCRTCWHGASSSWFEEAKILRNNLGDKAIIKASSDNPGLIDQLISLNSDFEEIYFAGGEPLMMEEHYMLLSKLIDAEQTKIHLRYNTNLSRLQLKDFNALDYWKKFEKITLSVSIDNLFEKVEYIRKGLKWDLFIDNIKQIKSKCPHIKIEIAPTISIYSILDLPQLHKYFVDNEIIHLNDIYLNVLDRPNYYNIKSFPKDLKLEARERINAHLVWLEEKGSSKKLIEEFTSIITYMELDDWTGQQKSFQKMSNQLDELREEQFEVIFPELSQLIQHKID